MSIIVTDKESREIRNLYLIEQNTKFKGKYDTQYNCYGCLRKL